jgi:hypothetical protein
MTSSLQERAFIPQKGLNYDIPLPEKNLSPFGLFELAEVIMHSISQSHNGSENKAVPRNRTLAPHMDAIIF